MKKIGPAPINKLIYPHLIAGLSIILNQAHNWHVITKFNSNMISDVASTFICIYGK